MNKQLGSVDSERFQTQNQTTSHISLNYQSQGSEYQLIKMNIYPENVDYFKSNTSNKQSKNEEVTSERIGSVMEGKSTISYDSNNKSIYNISIKHIDKSYKEIFKVELKPVSIDHSQNSR